MSEAAELQPSVTALPACMSAITLVGCLWKDGPVVLDGAVGGQCALLITVGRGAGNGK